MLFNWRYKAQIACHNQFFLPVPQLNVFPFFLKVQSIVSCVQWHAFQFPARNALLSGLIDRPFHIICLFRQNPSGGLLQVSFFSFFFFLRIIYFYLFEISNSMSPLLILFISGTLLLTWHYWLFIIRLLSLRDGNQKTDKTDLDDPQASVGFQFIHIHTNHNVFFCNNCLCHSCFIVFMDK